MLFVSSDFSALPIFIAKKRKENSRQMTKLMNICDNKQRAYELNALALIWLGISLFDEKLVEHNGRLRC